MEPSRPYKVVTTRKDTGETHSSFCQRIEGILNLFDRDYNMTHFNTSENFVIVVMIFKLKENK